MTSDAAELVFNVRNYGAADFDRLWQIDQRCFPSGIAYTQMELSGFITRRNAITLVAECDSGLLHPPLGSDGAADRIVGFAIAHPVRRKYGRILTLDILPEVRRSGLATRLMECCEQRLRDTGCTEIYLETAVNNEPALRLYHKLGYEVLRTLSDYYASHSLDAFLMGKRL